MALEKDLTADRRIGPAERAALRAQAHALDMAEAAGDVPQVTRASRTFLALLDAAGLATAAGRPPDPFGVLLASMSKPGAGASDR